MKPKATHLDVFGEPTHPELVRDHGYDEEDWITPEPGDDYVFTFLFSDGENRSVPVRGKSYSDAAKKAKTKLPELFERFGARSEKLLCVEIFDEFSEVRENCSWLID